MSSSTAELRRRTAYVLPHWSIGFSEGFTHVGTQLSTKDGRRFGNGVVIATETEEFPPPPVDIGTVTWVTVLTDMGNTAKFDSRQMGKFFHPPIWLMDLNSPEIQHRLKEAEQRWL